MSLSIFAYDILCIRDSYYASDYLRITLKIVFEVNYASKDHTQVVLKLKI